MDLYYKYQILAEKKSIELNIEMEEELPLVFTDIAVADRVIPDLMANA